jgi:hypothetical protein
MKKIVALRPWRSFLLDIGSARSPPMKTNDDVREGPDIAPADHSESGLIPRRPENVHTLVLLGSGRLGKRMENGMATRKAMASKKNTTPIHVT